MRNVAVHPAYAAEIARDREKQDELAKCALSFHHFLKYWRFLDQESGVERYLDGLWDGQEQLVEAMESVLKLYALKARKLGFTTLEVAYCAWVFRFRDRNARVHLFSRREAAAIELLDAVKYGLKRLPPWMTLPIVKDTTIELRWAAAPDDSRLLKAYPADQDTAVEATCTHAMVDEWARMGNPRRVWQAIEPSMAGSCHIITTGLGPVNFSAAFWRGAMAGDNEFAPIFVDALARAGRDGRWLEQKRRSMTEEAFRQEFPMTWEDALFGGGAFTFRAVDLDPAGKGVGPQAPIPGHKYVKCWDIGRHADAAVGTVVDVTATPRQVVQYVRLRGVPYPHLQKRIERMHSEYPGPTVIEKNGPGEAVAENLEIRERELILFNTSGTSKARIIENLQIALEGRALQWDAIAWPQLDAEMRGYQVPDDNIVQDSVMSLAINNEHMNSPFLAGKMSVIEV